MERKAALVLSGGGAKGAFQFMAEKYAREVKGYRWTTISGVSVGALNAVMLAMEKFQRLEEIWNTISSERVYNGKINFWNSLKIILGSKSFLSNKPLWNLIQEEYEPDKLNIDLRIGTVSLPSGEYVQFKPDCPNFSRAVLASTAIPLIWSPVWISEEYPEMIDGGVRNISPLGDVLDSDPDEVVIINCSPQKQLPVDTRGWNGIQIGLHSLEVVMNEIFVTDLREFIRINHNVREAIEHGYTLTNEDGKPYKYYSHKIIQPEENLGDIMDFSSRVTLMRMDAGWEAARRILGE